MLFCSGAAAPLEEGRALPRQSKDARLAPLSLRHGWSSRSSRLPGCAGQVLQGDIHAPGDLFQGEALAQEAADHGGDGLAYFDDVTVGVINAQNPLSPGLLPDRFLKCLIGELGVSGGPPDGAGQGDTSRYRGVSWKGWAVRGRYR